MALRKQRPLINRHEHKHCQHKNLKFCRDCNRPYCLSCGQEWNQYAYSYPYTLTTSTPTLSNNTLIGTVTDSIQVTNCSHELN